MTVDYEEGRRLREKAIGAEFIFGDSPSGLYLAWLVTHAEALLKPDPWRPISEMSDDLRDGDTAIDLWVNGDRRTNCWFMEERWWSRGIDGGWDELDPPTHFREAKGPGHA